MIICAAMRADGFGIDGKDLIIPCRRHGDGYYILRSLCKDDGYKRHVTEGFITHKGEFLDRKGALKHARICGQISETCGYYKQDHNQDELYSEDLY